MTWLCCGGSGDVAASVVVGDAARVVARFGGWGGVMVAVRRENDGCWVVWGRG